EVVTLLKETSAPAPAPPTARYQFGEGVIYYTAASVDGFVAAPDDDLTWLEPFRTVLDNVGYASFQRSIDAMLIGSYGFARMLGFEGHQKPSWMLPSDGSLKPMGSDGVAKGETAL